MLFLTWHVGAWRWNLNLEGQVVMGENFCKKSLEGAVFIECTFEGCDFSESILFNAKFTGCEFKSCNFSLPQLNGCRFQDVLLIDCKVIGAEFFKCDNAFFSMGFKNCLLEYCNFSDLNMKKASFIKSRLKECHFTNTVLNGVDFSGVDLSGTVFHNCDLSHADFSSAMRYDIDPRTNKIKKAKFSLPEAVGLLRGFDINLIN